MTPRPQKVVIVGRDAALWLTATALMEAFRPIGLKLTAVELPTHLRKSSTYATLPPLESLHSRLRIDEAALLRSTGGGFSLGWNFVRRGSPAFLLAHGSYGAPIDGSDFFGCWLKARQLGLDVAFENFSPTAMAARHGRILVPDESTEAFGRTDYGYHLPAIAYCAMLKRRAHELGVDIRHAIKVGIERDGVGGDIRTVSADAGTSIAGDLFIDASGPEGIVVDGCLGIGREGWRTYFPYDRVLRGWAKPFQSVPAYADLRLERHSWTALHGSQAATHVVHAYADDGRSAEAAAIAAFEGAGLTLSDVGITSSAPGLRADAWAANCIAIGAAACAFDPLFDLELHSVQLGIVHLLSLFPASGEAAVERVEFNRRMRSLFERLRDFQSAPYVLAGSTEASPAPLQQKLDAFQARGVIASMEDETFSADQWRALFVGLGVSPDNWPPAIDAAAPERLKQGFRRILGFVHDKVLAQPKHNDYLAAIGATAAP